MTRILKRLGDERTANSFTAGQQIGQKVAALPSGGYVVVWMGEYTDGDSYGINAQRFDADGTRVGAEIRVNLFGESSQDFPAVTALASGGFVVTWTHYWNAVAGGGDGSGNAVKARVFDANGVAVGPDFLVNTHVSGDQSDATVASLPGGGFVIGWTDRTQQPGADALRAQMFDASGAKIGQEFAINSAALAPGGQPEVEAMALAGGGFVFVWRHFSRSPGLDTVDIRAQIFDSAGNKIGGEFSVPAGGGEPGSDPDIAALPNGGFVVSWHGYDRALDSDLLRAQMFGPTGDRIGPQVTASNPGDRVGSVTVTSLAEGGFFLGWVASDVGAIRGQMYDSGGVPLGSQVQINSAPVDTIFTFPDLATLSSGRLVAVWQRESPSSFSDVKMQVFRAPLNEMTGTPLADTIDGTDEGDAIAGLASDDILNGNGGDDLIEGGEGADTIDGGRGSDLLHGGDGSDLALFSYAVSGAANRALRFIPNNNGDVRDFDVEQVTSQVSPGGTSFAYQIVFQVRFTGSTIVVTGAGTAAYLGSDTLTGFETLRFMIDGDAVSAIDLSPVEALVGGSGDDRIDGTGGRDAIDGGAGHDRLDGKDGNDSLRGGDGDDVLLSGAGIDSLSGGAGDDILYFGRDLRVTLNRDSVSGGSGYDQLVLQGYYEFIGGSDMFSGIERLVLLPKDDIRYGGPVQGDVHYDMEFNSDLLVAAGATLTVDGSALDAGWRFDGSDETDGTIVLIGGAGADSLTAGSGADVIDGRGGADQMVGRLGNDVYHVDDAGDQVTELVGEGIDEVRTSLATASLAAYANVENLTGTSATGQSLTGNSGNNVVTGGSGSDVLRLYDGGDDVANGGAGNDTLFFIGALTAADVVDGGDGADTLVIQGPYGSLALSGNVTRIENVSILGGNNTNFGEPGTNRYDYVLTTNDANFAAGVQARINGAALLAGEDFTFDGSAETDAKYVVYGGKGRDTLTGGLGNDIFFYAEERFASGDVVNGGSGYDGMFLRGNYTIDFTAPGYTGLFTSIENLTLTSATDERYARGGGTEFDYNLTLSDAIVKPGEQLTISGTLLMASESMILDGSQEADGLLRLFGGKAGDTLKGGGQNDLIHGGLGADILAGNGGADAFRYQDIAESNSGSMDQILDFTPGTDKIELDRIDANTLIGGDQGFSWIGSNAFSGQAGQLRAYQQGGTWIVEGDVNGDSVADLVIALTLQGPTPLSAGDFLL